MTKNPYLNALCAGLYIVCIVLLITYGPALVRGKPDTILAPIALLSILVCSVAFMGYTFFFQPILMYMEGQKRLAPSPRSQLSLCSLRLRRERSKATVAFRPIKTRGKWYAYHFPQA